MANEQENQPEKKGTDMEPINEFDQNHFYESDHIDKKTFDEDIRSNEGLVEQEISGTVSISDRLAEEEQEKKPQHHQPNSRPDAEPTQADGDKLMDVGRAPDS